MEISHEEFIIILNKKDKYEKMKENIGTIKSSDELSKEEGRIIETTELKVKIVEKHKIEKKLLCIKCLKLLLKYLLKTVLIQWK